MESQASRTSTAGMALVMRMAKKVTADLRAMVTDAPRWRRKPESHPPNRLPKPATRNGIQANLPMAARSKFRTRFRYSGNQKM